MVSTFWHDNNVNSRHFFLKNPFPYCCKKERRKERKNNSCARLKYFFRFLLQFWETTCVVFVKQFCPGVVFLGKAGAHPSEAPDSVLLWWQVINLTCYQHFFHCLFQFWEMDSTVLISVTYIQVELG
jgi:hypothetical protein